MFRLASLLWRLRRATTMETGLFEIQADYLREFRQGCQTQQNPRKLSMQGGGLILSMPTPVEHRTASQTERKPGPALGRNPYCVSIATNMPQAKQRSVKAQKTPR